MRPFITPGRLSYFRIGVSSYRLDGREADASRRSQKAWAGYAAPRRRTAGSKVTLGHAGRRGRRGGPRAALRRLTHNPIQVGCGRDPLQGRGPPEMGVPPGAGTTASSASAGAILDGA